jgi:hypothetical protein
MTGQPSTNTVTQQSGPPAQVLQNYSNLTNAATSLAGQPLNLYGGPMVEGFSPDQQAAFSAVENAQGVQSPYIDAASQEFGQATNPLWSQEPQFSTGQTTGMANQGYQGLGQAATVANGLQSGTAPYVGSASSTAGGLQAGVNPYLQAGTQYNESAYESPYTQQVTQATQNLLNQQNATQLQQVQGNAASAGAYGGDREAVAQALTAQQQQLAEAPELANIEQQGFQQAQQESNTEQGLQLQAGQLGLGAGTAAIQGELGAGQLGLGAGTAAGQLGLGAAQGQLGEFNTEQQQELSANQANAWLASQAGFGEAGLGNQAETGALTDASALLQTGGLQQQLGQEQLNIPEQEFTAEQAYPYQTLGFLAPIIEGTGSLSGGTGSTTYPGQSTLSQLTGLGMTGLGVAGLASNSGLFGGGGGSGTGSYNDAGGGAGPGEYNYGSARGGRVANGGRIGLAGGGAMSMPLLGGGIGDSPNVPDITLSYIPQEAPGGIPNSGLGINSSTGSTSTTSGGGSSPLSGVEGIAGLVGAGKTIASGIGALAALFARGGRIYRDRGGIVRLGFDDGGSTGGLASPIGVSSSIPTISIDQIIHPGPEVKGAGPPKAPNAPAGAGQNSGFGAEQGEQLLGLSKSLGGTFGGKTTTTTTGNPGDSSGNAKGGRIGLQSGGQGSVPLSVAAQFGGAPPTTTGAMQQLAQMPLDRLQQMAVQFPPNTQQGALIQTAIRQKQATPGSGTTPVAGPGATPSISATQQPGLTPQQIAAIGQAPPQNYNGTSHSMADGGNAGDRNFVTEDELDPQPIVDHSGDTIKIRYPSEGKVLDLGLPSMKSRRALAAGGATGGTKPPAPTFAPSTYGTPDVAQLISGGNGVALPQLGGNQSISHQFTDPLTGTAYAPGGGSGNWFAPQAQYQPPGTTIGAGGSTSFPSIQPSIPAMGGVASALGVTPAPSAGGPVPGVSISTSSSNGSFGLTPQQIAANNALNAMTLGGGNFTNSSSKRGGRAGFDDGGDTGDVKNFVTPDNVPDVFTDESSPFTGIPPAPPPTTPEPKDKSPPPMPADLHPGLAGPPDKAGLAAAPLDTGEPRPPAAMVTPDRAPLPTHIGLSGNGPNAQLIDQDTGKPIAGNGLAAGFSRGPDGMLTRNGQPPDTYIGGALPGGGAVPAWKEPNSPTSGAAGTSPPSTGRGMVEDFWTSHGVPPHVAAGIADRVNVESGFNPGAWTPDDNGSPSGGLYQHHATRSTDLQDFAQQQKADWRDPAIQNQFAWNEVHGGDSIATQHWNEILAAPNRQTAEQLWTKYFERGVPDNGSGTGPALASSSSRNAPASPAGTQLADAGLSDTTNSPGLAGGLTKASYAPDYQSTGTTPTPGASAHRGFSLSDYGMPLLIAGLSSLSSRSPNAVAEGFKAAAPYFTAGERNEAALNNADVRQQANQSVAAARAQTNETQLAAIQQRADAANVAAQNAQARLAEAAAHNQVTEQLRAQTDAAMAAAREANLNLAAMKVQTGEYTQPVYGQKDPSDPNSPKGLWYYPKNPNTDLKPTFVEGVGTPRQATGEQGIINNLLASGEAKSEGEAIQKLAGWRAHPDTMAHDIAIAGLVAKEKATDPTGQMSDAQALSRVQKNILGAQQVTGAPAAAPAQAPRAAAPAVTPQIGPTATGPNGEKIHWDGKAWVPVPGAAPSAPGP